MKEPSDKHHSRAASAFSDSEGISSSGEPVIPDGLSAEGIMARAYSQDLRERVLSATAAGTSARQAAERFGVGVSTAIVWVRRARLNGERTARRQGQPRRSKLGRPRRVPARAGGSHLRHHLERECRRGCARESAGVSAGSERWSRFFGRQDYSWKKNRARPSRARIGRTSWPRVRQWFDAQPTSTPSGWCSSTRPAPPPRWPAQRGRGPAGVNGMRPARPMDIGKRRPSSRPAARRHDRAHGARRTHDQRLVPGLRRAGPGPHPAPAATSWSSTTCPPTRGAAVRARRRGPPEPGSCSSRPTRPTSTHRERLLQAQGAPTQSRSPHRRPALQASPPPSTRSRPATCVGYFTAAGYEPD